MMGGGGGGPFRGGPPGMQGGPPPGMHGGGMGPPGMGEWELKLRYLSYVHACVCVFLFVLDLSVLVVRDCFECAR